MGRLRRWWAGPSKVRIRFRRLEGQRLTIILALGNKNTNFPHPKSPVWRGSTHRPQTSRADPRTVKPFWFAGSNSATGVGCRRHFPGSVLHPPLVPRDDGSAQCCAVGATDRQFQASLQSAKDAVFVTINRRDMH